MQTTELTVGDITRMALSMEEKGRNLYTWAARRFSDDEVVHMFRRLADEEKEHAEVFRRLLVLPEANQPVSHDTDRYFTLLAGSGSIFPTHGEFSDERVKTPADALALGIQAEKDAILFYQEMYNKTESSAVKSALSKLLAEEKMHLLELRDSMEELEHLRQDNQFRRL